MLDFVWLIGLIASICITISMIPQTYKMWTLRHQPLEEFHTLWFIFNIVGCLLFVYYGYCIGQIGLIILNFVGLISMFLMILIYYGFWWDKDE